MLKINSLRRIISGAVLMHLFSYATGQICPVPSTVNLIANGNFESCVKGVPATDGFSTDYTYTGLTTCPGGENSATISTYTVTTNANALNSAYGNPTGTPGSGNPTPNHYLLVDVDGDITKSTYNTTVNVVAGTTYFFSAWMADINSGFANPPILEFLINGVQVGSTVNVNPSGNSHDWQQFYVLWNSPVTGSINISIRNDRPTSAGNDLALDNISFTSSCAYLQNSNTIGKTSTLIDTLYTCNVAYPYTLNPLLGAGYNLQWKNSVGTVLGLGSTYTFASAPATGKYYLCYDTISGCPRADSVIVVNSLKVNIKPDQILCPPVNFIINPGLTAAGINYEWRLNGTTVANSTAATTYQATQVGTYMLIVTKAGCTSSTSQMVISSPVVTLQGTASCSGGNYQFNATAGTYTTISGVSKVGWYNVPSGGSPINSSGISATVTASGLVAVPGCSPGGLYAEDLNSFSTTLGPANPPCATSAITGANAGAIELIVYSTVTLNSLKIEQKNYSTGGNATYTVEIRNNSVAGGPYSSVCGCTTDGPGTLIAAASGPTLTVPLTTTATVRTLAVGPSGNGYTLTGTPTGTKYWITISGSEFDYFSCGTSYPISNSPVPGIVQFNRQLVYGGESTQMEAFNLQFTSGTPNPCNRIWVCAPSCGLPVTFLYVQGTNENSENGIVWATASEVNNDCFIIERSLDGINFTSIGKVKGIGTISSTQTYSFIDQQSPDLGYYRLKQLDLDSNYFYSEIITIKNTQTDFQIYPNPNQGTFHVRVESAYQSYGMEIINLEGKSVYLTSGKEVYEEFEIKELPKGIYFVQLKVKDKILTKKLCIY